MSYADVEKRRETRRAWRERNRDRILAADRARKASYGRPCLDCGKTTDGSNGRARAPERCTRCENRSRTTWTPETIIAAIQTYAHRYGQPPSATDFNPTLARGKGRPDVAHVFDVDGDYPPTSAVQREFGSWNAGIAAAGFEPRRIGVRGPCRPPVTPATRTEAAPERLIPVPSKEHDRSPAAADSASPSTPPASP